MVIEHQMWWLHVATLLSHKPISAFEKTGFAILLVPIGSAFPLCRLMLRSKLLSILPSLSLVCCDRIYSSWFPTNHHFNSTLVLFLRFPVASFKQLPSGEDINNIASWKIPELNGHWNTNSLELNGFSTHIHVITSIGCSSFNVWFIASPMIHFFLVKSSFW